MDMTPPVPAPMTGSVSGPVSAPASGHVALLVDAENLSVTHARRILDLSAALGRVTVRRAYGKAQHLAEWENHGFRLIPASMAKNSADLSLCVDAMTLALRESFPTLVIASSDRDFSPLALQLRELGFLVVGMGGEKAPLALRHACSGFVDLSEQVAILPKPKPSAPCPILAPQPAKPKPTVASPIPSAAVLQIPAVDAAARRLCRAEGDASGTMALSTLCHRLAAEGVSRKATGKATWSSYFRSHPGFHLTGQGGSLAIRPR